MVSMMVNEDPHSLEELLKVKEYIQAIRKIPLLTLDQEQGLLKRIAQGDEFARVRLIEANLRLPVAIGKEYMDQGLKFSEIYEEGNKGLIWAIDKYRFENGCKFSTVAAWWIRYRIKRAIANKSKPVINPFQIAEDDPFKYIIEGDRFVEHICIKCGFQSFTFPLPYTVTICSNCLSDRIAELRRAENDMPDWVAILEENANFRKNIQVATKEGQLLFSECKSCKKAIFPGNARTYFPPGVHESYLYCIECHERLSRQVG
jgi:RNA polymerase sigma factor (sigma-70 family)